jgi:hypothetical protein
MGIVGAVSSKDALGDRLASAGVEELARRWHDGSNLFWTEPRAGATIEMAPSSRENYGKSLIHRCLGGRSRFAIQSMHDPT